MSRHDKRYRSEAISPPNIFMLLEWLVIIDYSSSCCCVDQNDLDISVIIDVTALSGETLEIIFNNVFE